jgi:hypothetical protein
MVICQCIKAQAGQALVVLQDILGHVDKMGLLAIMDQLVILVHADKMALLAIMDQLVILAAWAWAIPVVPALYLVTQAAWAWAILVQQQLVAELPHRLVVKPILQLTFLDCLVGLLHNVRGAQLTAIPDTILRYE